MERELEEEARHRARRRRGARDFEPERDEDEQYGFRYEEPVEDRYRPERARRPERRAFRNEGINEERVTRILDDAFDAMQHTLRLNEDRTAEAIENLARRIDDRRGADNRVREMQSGIERDFKPPRAPEPARRARAACERVRDEDFPTPSSAPDRGLEQQIAALGERIDGLVRHVVAKPVEERAPSPPEQAPLDRLRAEVARLNGVQTRTQPQGDHLIDALRSHDAKVGRLAAPADPGFSAVAGQLHSLSERLDAIAEKWRACAFRVLATCVPTGPSTTLSRS